MAVVLAEPPWPSPAQDVGEVAVVLAEPLRLELLEEPLLHRDLTIISPGEGSPSPHETTTAVSSVTAGTSTEERVDILQNMLNDCLSTMKAQQEQIGQHKATIDKLQLVDPEEIQTSAYIVGDTRCCANWARVAMDHGLGSSPFPARNEI